MANTKKPIYGTTSRNTSKYKFYIVITEGTQNIPKNTSPATVDVYLEYINWGWQTSHASKIECVFDGTSKSSSYTSNRPSGYSGTVKVASFDFPSVQHNSDGTKTASVSVTFTSGGTASYAPGTCSASGTFTFTTIPRASSFGTIDGNMIGKNMTVNIIRNSEVFTHQLWYKFEDDDWCDLGADIATSKTFTISNELLYKIQTSISGSLQLRLCTYSGTTQIGEYVYKDVTVYVDESVKPKIGTITLEPQTYGYLIQNKNKLKISISDCEAGTGSSIKSYTFSGPGISSTTSNTSVIFGPISSTETLTYEVTVTDGRDRKATATQTITCYKYASPYFVSFDAYRANANEEANSNGTYLKCTYDAAFSYVNGTNNIEVIAYYVSGTEQKEAVGVDGSVFVNLEENTKTYNVYLIVRDSYGGEVSSTTITVFGQSRIMNISADGDGIAFGKMSEKTSSHTNGLLECKWDAEFLGDVSISGDVSFNSPVSVANGGTGATTAEAARTELGITPENIGVVSYMVERGQSGIWTYSKYSDGWCELVGRYAVTMQITSAFGGLYRSNEAYKHDFPTGFEFENDPYCLAVVSSTSVNDWALWAIQNYGASTTQSSSVYGARPNSSGDVPAVITWSVSGYLKQDN